MEYFQVDLSSDGRPISEERNTSEYNYTTNIAAVLLLKNSSNVEGDAARERFQDLIYILLYSLTCVLSLIGNSTVCTVVFGKPSMRNFTNILLANMAISDIVCALTFPFGLLMCWNTVINQTGNYACVTLKVIQLMSFQVSSVTMTVVAIDRFMLVQYPLMRKHRFVAVYVWIIAVWLVSLVIIVGTSPSLAFHRYFTPLESYIKCESALVFAHGSLSPREQRVRLIIANLSHFWIPLCVICLCYGSIACKVLRRNIGHDMTNIQQDALLRAKWKTIKMLIAAVVVFVVCWFPFFILNFMDFMGNPQKKRPCNKSGSFFIAVWIAFTSCCWNPLVYWIYSKDFRQGLLGIGKIFKLKSIFSTATTTSSKPSDIINTIVLHERRRTLSSNISIEH